MLVIVMFRLYVVMLFRVDAGKFQDGLTSLIPTQKSTAI